MKHILSILILVSLIISALPITSFADSNVENVSDNQTNMQEATAIDTHSLLNIVGLKSHYLPTENIVSAFNVTHTNEIVDFTYDNSGFSIIELAVDETEANVLNVELSCPTTQTECTLQITVQLASGDTLTSYLYAYNDAEHGAFISRCSIDNAREQYLDYAFNQGIITQRELNSIWDDISKIGGSVRTSATVTPGNKGTVFGKLEWKDDNTTPHPLRNVKVEAYNKGNFFDLLIGTTYTDNEGNFSLQLLPSSQVYLKIYAGDSNVLVKSGILERDYQCVFNNNDNYINVTAGSTIEAAIDSITMDDDWGKAFQIGQATLTARDYAGAMMGETPSNVTVIYPYDGEIKEVPNQDDLNGCHYNHLLKTINITGLYLDTPFNPKSYSSWDEIMHEYGHHVQNDLAFFDNPGGGHSISIPIAEHFMSHYISNDFVNCDSSCVIQNAFNLPSLIVTESQCKIKGCSMAWAEAWATIFGNMAQEYFSTFLEDIRFVNDANYSFDTGSILSFRDVINISDDGTKTIILTEDVEVNIQALLYDMYDSADDEKEELFDKISFSHEKMWTYFTDSEAKTLYEFIEHVKENEDKYVVSNLGKLLYEYKLNTTAPTISYISTDCPEVEFEWDDHNENGYFNDRKFSVNFYDFSNNLIGSTTPQDVIVDEGTHIGTIQIDEALWQSVLNLDSAFYVSVTVGEYDGDKTDSDEDCFITKYESEYTLYNLNDVYEEIEYADEITKTLEEGEYYWFKFVAPSDDEFIFESTGTAYICGELFSGLAAGQSFTNRIAYDYPTGIDNNFSISYNMNRGDVVYLRIRGYAWAYTGDFTLSMSSPDHVHSYTYSYSSYSSILHTSYCICGDSIREMHEFQITLLNQICKHCNYSTSTDRPVVKDSIEDDTADVCNDIYYIPEEDN